MSATQPTRMRCGGRSQATAAANVAGVVEGADDRQRRRLRASSSAATSRTSSSVTASIRPSSVVQLSSSP